MITSIQLSIININETKYKMRHNSASLLNEYEPTVNIFGQAQTNHLLQSLEKLNYIVAGFQNDNLGRIEEAAGHGIVTLHSHDDFGNNIKHQAYTSSSMPPNTMISWEFPPLLNNRIPTETITGAQTWWQYRKNGEASWIGKTPGGDKIQLDWDGLGLLKAVSDTVGNTINARHDFTYAPSGLRIRDKRTGTAPHDKRYAYTTGGALLTAYDLSPSNTNTITGRRDIVYANGEAIAEIDQNNNIYELHNDYLGSPRYITSGSTGQIVGEQVFGPYGEQMTGTFNGKTLPSGYRPITGYTGHINEDLTGLIYMRGRYYSPKWHRFINSDQGVDPNSINQFAYVNGSPFMATDPSGMERGWKISVNGVMHTFATLEEVFNFLGGIFGNAGYDFKIFEADGTITYGTTVPVIGPPSSPISYATFGSYLPWYITDMQDRNTGGGGGASAAGGGGTGASQSAPTTSKTDCEKYVDALVGHASGYKNNYPFTGSIRFGIDLFERAWDDIQFSSFGLAPNWSGFKYNLVNGEQKSGVYRHVSASIGSVMMAGGGIIGMLLPTIWTLGRDLPAHIKGNTEALAQMHGNATGILLATAFNDFFVGLAQTESLRKSIMSTLCQK